MTEFKTGDRVKIKHFDHYEIGEITIIRHIDGWPKVLFENCELDYTYYDPKELELVPVTNRIGDD